MGFPEAEAALQELLRPAPAPDGSVAEQRMVFCGIPWERYLAFDRRLGDDRPVPRLYYLEGELEIMTTSKEHERIKKWIGGFMDIYFDEVRTEVMPRGQATMRQALKEAGAEPDESWCIGQEKEFPDLVLEIALTSGGIDKLEIYRRFKVPEVWLWRRNRLEVCVVGANGAYESSRMSHLLPGLDIPLLERCAAIQSWHAAREAFRAGLAKVK